jgi:predicted metal-dependent phosphoesterase TrpH
MMQGHPAMSMLRYDLHAHSTRSDGLLAPGDVVRRAAQRGVEVLALTDHDDTAGLAEAADAAREAGIVLVPGAEVSVTWEDHTIHVVALGIDPEAPALAAGLEALRAGRDARGRRIADALERAGIPGAWEGARRYVTSERLVSRTHFARFLVEAGHVREMKDVFARYLARGLPGYVEHAWAALDEAVGWIHAAGGQAVLAHPGRYKVSSTGVRRLLGAFRDAGGNAIEVLSPSHTAAQVAQFASLARAFGLKASTGSDWHGPGESRLDLGDLPPLPGGTVPVWQAW